MSKPYDPDNPYGGSTPGGCYGPPPTGGAGGGGYGGGGYGAPYGQPGGYGNDLPKKTDSVSIVGFMLSLTVCLSLVGVVLGLIGLARTRGGKRKGRWAAVGAVVIGLLVSIGSGLVVTVLARYDSSSLSVEEVEAGMCVSPTFDDLHNVDFTEVDCSSEHLFEVVYAGDAGVDAAELVSDSAPSVCVERISSETPELIDILGDDHQFFVALERPREVSPADRFVCYVASINDQFLTGRLTPGA